MTTFAHPDTTKKCNRKKTDSIDFFEPKGEPQLNALIGFDNCSQCYFRISTIERIQADVKQLRGRA